MNARIQKPPALRREEAVTVTGGRRQEITSKYFYRSAMGPALMVCLSQWPGFNNALVFRTAQCEWELSVLQILAKAGSLEHRTQKQEVSTHPADPRRLMTGE